MDGMDKAVDACNECYIADVGVVIVKSGVLQGRMINL